MENDLRRRQERQKRKRRRKWQGRLRLALTISGIFLLAVLGIAYTMQQRDIQTFGSDTDAETEDAEEPVAEDRGITVVVDAGHGGKDQGCSYGELLEKDINLQIALKLKKKLEKSGFYVIMTREDDTFISLGGRVEMAEEAKADVFVSIHVDSYTDDESINGASVYYETGADGGRVLANELFAAIDSAKGVSTRKVTESDLYVLRNTTMPAALVETGYITNSTDRENLQSKKFQEKLADCICSGIITYFSENGDNS
jgi:N-acetylmuramoyl-L-alanine amidase